MQNQLGTQPNMTTLGDGLQYPIEAERIFMPTDVYEIGSMLSFEERLFLHHAARTGIPGAIVDLGAFLGGSTLALGSGAEHRDARVDSYDLFRLADDWEKEWFPEGMDVEIGESTLPIYEHNIRRVRDRVTVHEGDVAEAVWNEPISVLFVDIAKSWTTADAVWNTFFPWLQPGSLVIQQDLVHWGHPWCAVIMEHLADHFDYLGWTWMGSSVWRCKVPPKELPPMMLRAFSCDQMLELLDRAAERVGEPASGSIRLSGTKVLMSYGKRAGAQARLEEIRATLSNEELPFIEEGFAVYDGLLA
jgi:predicted O-methyltransferase YrrM